MNMPIFLLRVLLAFTAIASFNAAAEHFSVPSTISAPAQKAVSEFLRMDDALPKPTDMEGWQEAWRQKEADEREENLAVAKHFGATIETVDIGNVRALDIRPRNWRDNGKVLIYTHGGAYTLYSASSTLTSSIPVADATSLRVISVDYTVAPHAKWQETTAQVVSVIKWLIESGYALKDIAIYGDSAGGGLTAGSVLRARDEGVGLVGAVVLWSPWSDISSVGDTYSTLRKADPINSLENAAAAYADPADHRHLYVSPVYGDYTIGFPPTLIQVGTKEIFLSNAIRHYQALDQAGIEVKLDPYEGMWHVFQAFHWRLPESDTARTKMARFLREHLGY